MGGSFLVTGVGIGTTRSSQISQSVDTTVSISQSVDTAVSISQSVDTAVSISQSVDTAVSISSSGLQTCVTITCKFR